MALVPRAQDNLSPEERTKVALESKERCEMLRTKNVMEYQYRKRNGLVPLDILIDIEKSRKAQE